MSKGKTSLSVAIGTNEADIAIRMSRHTAVAIGIGLARCAEQPSQSRRAREFYATVATVINSAVANDDNEINIATNGVGVLVEDSELRSGKPEAVPTLFSGRWEFEDMSNPMQMLHRMEVRITATTVFDFAQKVVKEGVSLPAGAVDWLIAAPIGSRVTFNDEKKTAVTLLVTGRP